MNIQNKYSKIMYIKMYKYYVKCICINERKAEKNRGYREKEEGESEREKLPQAVVGDRFRVVKTIRI